MLSWVHAQSLSRVWLFVTLWTIANQAPLSVEYSRQEYWTTYPFPSPGDLSDPRIEPRSPVSAALQVDSLPLHHLGSPNTIIMFVYKSICKIHSSSKKLLSDKEPCFGDASLRGWSNTWFWAFFTYTLKMLYHSWPPIERNLYRDLLDCEEGVILNWTWIGFRLLSNLVFPLAIVLAKPS